MDRDDFELIVEAIEEIRKRIIDLELGYRESWRESWKVQLTWTPDAVKESQKGAGDGKM